jgi:hypothetical protein
MGLGVTVVIYLLTKLDLIILGLHDFDFTSSDAPRLRRKTYDNFPLVLMTMVTFCRE